MTFQERKAITRKVWIHLGKTRSSLGFNWSNDYIYNDYMFIYFDDIYKIYKEEIMEN